MDSNLEDFNTLSGEITKDTLSYSERKKIMKKSNKTREDSHKLTMDDSYGGMRSTWGCFIQDKEVYNPNVEYFFVSYIYEEEGMVRWIREVYLTRADLLQVVRDMTKNYNKYHNFEILSELELDQKSKYMCEDGVERELTLREWRFGDSYQGLSDRVKENPEMIGNLKY